MMMPESPYAYLLDSPCSAWPRPRSFGELITQVHALSGELDGLVSLAQGEALTDPVLLRERLTTFVARAMAPRDETAAGMILLATVPLLAALGQALLEHGILRGLDDSAG